MKKTILIADDDSDLVKMLSDMLQFEGFETVAAYEGIRAIELTHKRKPDLILLDVQMPAGTGQTVIQALKSKVETQNIPIIVITGNQREGIKEEVVKLGAKDFILKPYDKKDLLTKIVSYIPNY